MKINVISSSPVLKYAVHYQRDGEENTRSTHLTLKHTRHSFKRASQRGLNAEKIAAALEYGETYFKQGLVFYVLGENNIPHHMQKESKTLKNTVVVVSGDNNQVITCYRSYNPFKHIRMKGKQLLTHELLAA